MENRMKTIEQAEIENKVEELICLIKNLDTLDEQYKHLTMALLFHQNGILNLAMPELSNP
jgi:hypothetical protein